MSSVSRLGMVLATSLAVAGCAGSGIRGVDMRWTEEVKLSDGQIIRVERFTEIAANAGFPANRRGLFKAHELCYPPMNIHWKSKGAYKPDIFDIVDGKAYMHVSIAAQYECNQQGNPSPNALYFVWESGQWKRITHEQFPNASEWNLLLSSQGSTQEDDVKDLVTIRDKLEQKDGLYHYQQQRDGWKRVNESFYYRKGCTPWGKTSTKLSPDAVSIFVNDGKNNCQP